ncbi:MAG TPA: primary-amine oxidase [Methylomirabilota bacterium]|nr:primary-amine oxidase [Methylomirabilota bacterium]
MATVVATSRSTAHPLDPLRADEITRAWEILRAERRLGPRARAVSIALHEPPKEVVLAHRPGGAVTRAAFVVLMDREAGKTYEAVVSLSEGRVVSWEHVPGVQPAIILDEFFECEAAVRADPRWQEAMRKRGVTDFSLAMVDSWSAGYFPQEGEEGRRLVRALTWVRRSPRDNGYARPVANLLTVVDLNEMKVLRVEDHGVVPLPPEDANYSPEVAGSRADLRPIEIRQPEGPSFEVDGHEVRWQKWRLRIGFTPREGLVLHTVTYQDQGRERPILYRASVVDMVVPYGDPRPTYFHRNAFDVGEYGIGTLANALVNGCDCLGEIRYLDAVVNNGAGEPTTLPNAICLHEEDAGILWKHFDWRTGYSEVRRSRRFVVSFVATVGNYEYGFYWYFYQDGTIQLEVKMTGVISNGAVAPGERPRWGAIVAPGVYGPIHQHFFNVRLDMMVDGPDNSVYEVDTVADPPGPDNPHHNAFHTESTLLGTESRAQRLIDPLVGRFWTIVNPSRPNRVGEPVGYKLMPGENMLPFAGPEAQVTRRAAFMSRHLWVTRYAPRERYAAGDYPNQHPGGDGLPLYARDDASLVNTDVVVWYTFGAHHVVRPEDWPVMPVTGIGFMLKPVGFFDRNPALDVPPPMNHHECSGHP